MTFQGKAQGRCTLNQGSAQVHMWLVKCGPPTLLVFILSYKLHQVQPRVSSEVSIGQKVDKFIFSEDRQKLVHKEIRER